MLNQIRSKVAEFLAKEDGPTAVEYAVMLTLIILVCIAAIQILGRNTNSAFGTAAASIGATVAAT